MGLDAGDLEDYGFEMKSKNCKSNCVSLNKQKIKNFDDFYNQGSRLGSNMMKKGSEVLNKAKCHPMYKEKV